MEAASKKKFPKHKSPRGRKAHCGSKSFLRAEVFLEFLLLKRFLLLQLASRNTLAVAVALLRSVGQGLRSKRARQTLNDGCHNGLRRAREAFLPADFGET